VEYTPLKILLLLPILVGAGVASVGAASTAGRRGRAATVAYLPATVESFLMRLAAAALGIFYDASVDVGGEGYWCSRALANAAALARYSSS
jgi:hypothetical protein